MNKNQQTKPLLHEPILMGFQNGALNCDTFAQAEFKRLQKEFNLQIAIETGTCLGYTTAFLATFFDEVRTVEINKTYFVLPLHNRLATLPNVVQYLGSSVDLMPTMLTNLKAGVFVFLDAHWGEHCPLKEELQAIANAGIEPVIAIHDFVVSNHPELGYDKIGEQPFCFEWLKEDFDAIYGEDNYNYHYNTEAVGAMRGIIYVTPKN